MKAVWVTILWFAATSPALAISGTWNGGGVWADATGKRVPYEVEMTTSDIERGMVISVTGKWENPETGKHQEMTEVIVKRFTEGLNFDVYLRSAAGETLAGKGACVELTSENGSALNCKSQYRNAMGFLINSEGLFCNKTKILSRQGVMELGFERHTYNEILIPRS